MDLTYHLTSIFLSTRRFRFFFRCAICDVTNWTQFCIFAFRCHLLSQHHHQQLVYYRERKTFWWHLTFSHLLLLLQKRQLGDKWSHDSNLKIKKYGIQKQFVKKPWTRCLKIIEKVSYNIASKASYVYILSGQKILKNVKNGPFWRVFENLKLAVKQSYYTGQF